jgi:hypothetical protein
MLACTNCSRKPSSINHTLYISKTDAEPCKLSVKVADLGRRTEELLAWINGRRHDALWQYGVITSIGFRHGTKRRSGSATSRVRPLRPFRLRGMTSEDRCIHRRQIVRNSTEVGSGAGDLFPQYTDTGMMVCATTAATNHGWAYLTHETYEKSCHSSVDIPSQA